MTATEQGYRVHVERRPQGPLRAFVSSIGATAGSGRTPAVENVLPSGAVNLMIALDGHQFRSPDGSSQVSDAIIGGASDRPARVDLRAEWDHVWVDFLPGRAPDLLGLSASAVANDTVDLREVWPTGVSALQDRLGATRAPLDKLVLIEAALTARLVRSTASRIITAAVAYLEQGASARATADAIGISAKRLVAMFRDRVGLTPKRFARVVRLQATAATVFGAAEVDWSAVAIDHGYFDQSHMVNEFRELAGITPTAYLAGSTHHRNHVSA
jgi:AraC-like DNA-binding protein